MLHDALDHALSPLATGPDYPRFLAMQYSARAPIEDWFATSGSSPRPPDQTSLIAADLRELQCPTPLPELGFEPVVEGETIGIAWALAGSSLGNKFMLKRRRSVDGGIATRFLADGAMPHFWRELLPALETVASRECTEQAIAGASRVFDHFLAVTQRGARRLAA
ncbi:MAG: biliverdin-producing heme oxygenase [Erythrobacter sp.]